MVTLTPIGDSASFVARLVDEILAAHGRLTAAVERWQTR